MNLWQGKRERILTLPVIAWCNKKKVLEMCVGFTCPHFGSQWTGEDSWVGSPPHEEAWGCCVPDSLQGTAKSHGWAPQLNNDILGKAVRKGQKMLHSSFKNEELEKHVRNSPVNSKRREGGRALEQTWVAGTTTVDQVSTVQPTENLTLWLVEISWKNLYPWRAHITAESWQELQAMGRSPCRNRLSVWSRFSGACGEPTQDQFTKSVSCGEGLCTEAGKKCE